MLAMTEIVMSKLTSMTPEDVIHAFCGAQTSQTYPAAPRTYTPLAEDLLLCSFGATPSADNASAKCSTHAGAARWLQRTTVLLSEVCEGGPSPRRRASLAEEEAPTPGVDTFIFARCSSMPDSPGAVQAD